MVIFHSYVSLPEGYCKIKLNDVECVPPQSLLIEGPFKDQQKNPNLAVQWLCMSRANTDFSDKPV